MRTPSFAVFCIAMLAAPAAAQLGLPGVSLPDTGGILDPVTGTIDSLDEDVRDSAQDLLRQRERTLSRFLRRNRAHVEADRNGAPARRGELLVMDLSAPDRATIEAQGYVLISSERIDGLDIEVTRIAIPEGRELAEAEDELGMLLTDGVVSADHVHFRSGTTLLSVAQSGSTGAAQARIATPVGIIDGAPGANTPHSRFRGFAEGAGQPSDHASALAHLLSANGIADIRIADVYGTDPAGGGALAIARGLGWLAQDGARVVTISLVGPRNTVLERAVAAARARRRGVIVVAPVGNDGPAAPPAYPASYDGVLAVTGVDRRRRALIEAGRALHLDYAAPAADLHARNARGRRVQLRGTSFAAPLVSARAAHALARRDNWQGQLDSEALDLGVEGPDPVFGRGLLCSDCGGN